MIDPAEVYDRLAAQDPFHPSRPLPETLEDPEPVYEASVVVAASGRPRTTPRSGRPLLLASAAAVAIVLAIGLAWIPRSRDPRVPGIGVDQATAQAASAGDPHAVAHVWWQAFWSGEVDTFVSLTAPDIVSANTLPRLIGESEWHAALNPGGTPFDILECETAVGFDDRVRCRFRVAFTSRGYAWAVGDEQTFTASIVEGLVTSVSFRWATIADPAPLIAIGTQWDAAGFEAACRVSDSDHQRVLGGANPLSGRQEPALDPVAPTGDGADPGFVYLNSRCGEFLGRALAGG